jgi:hypothetical protein
LNFKSPCPGSDVPIVPKDEDVEMSFQPTTDALESKGIEGHVDNAETEQIAAGSCLEVPLLLMEPKAEVPSI